MYTLNHEILSRERPGPSYALATRTSNQSDRDDTAPSTTIETPQHEIHFDAPADHHASDSKSRDTGAKHLERMEEMFAQKLKAHSPISAVLALQERVSRLEERVATNLRIASDTGNTSEGPGVVDKPGMTHTGNLQASNPKDCDDGIKVHHIIALVAIAAAICIFIISVVVSEQHNSVTAGIAVAFCAFIIAMGHILNQKIMCKVDDFREWSPAAFVMSLVVLAVVLVGMFIWVSFVSWLANRFLRGQKTGEVVTAEGDNDALLIFGDEELEEDEEEPKRDIVATQTLDQVHTDEQNDSQQFGPYQHNTDNHL